MRKIHRRIQRAFDISLGSVVLYRPRARVSWGEEEEFSMEEHRESRTDFALFPCKIAVKFKNICDREESIMKAFLSK